MFKDRGRERERKRHRNIDKEIDAQLGRGLTDSTVCQLPVAKRVELSVT